MFLARAVVALIAAHFLPGLLLANGLRLGRTAAERWVLASILGGPIAAVVYVVSLALDWPVVYWVLLVGLNFASLLLLILERRRGARLARETDSSRRVWLGLVGLIVLVGLAYIATTGTSFRFDGEGHLLMDRALQRDTLFHVGMIRSLQSSYPPGFLSTSGVYVHYHLLYHLQLAAWSKYFGMDVFDAVYRVGVLWSLVLLIASAFLVGRRFTGNDVSGLLSAFLIFGTGLGFLFFWTSSADWWSLAFLDVALVSVFLPNPLLPGLVLFFAGLVCLHDYLDSGRRGALTGSALLLVSLLQVKVFLGAQALGGIILAALLAGRNSRRLRVAALVQILAALPVAIWTYFGAEAGNTAVRLRPLEIVRYSMEKLDWAQAVQALSDVGRGELSGVGLVLLATILWVAGFLGLRAIGLPGLVRDVRERLANVRFPMALAALLGVPVALVFRIAPAEATGLSRLEAINDVIWFAAQSGILLWFWTAEALHSLAQRSSFHRLAAVGLVVFLALPGTIQHFFFRLSLGSDVVPTEMVEAATRARVVSAPGEVWVEPPNRMRPSLTAYVAGRPVVHDAFVGYDYMFVPRGEIDYRRRAVAQFWRSKDPAYAQWFLSHYSVSGVFATTDRPLPSAAHVWMEEVYSNPACRLFRTAPSRFVSGLLQTPRRLPLGLGGVSFFGRGWGRPSGSPRTRALFPGTAVLYVPVQIGVALTIRLELKPPHAEGTLRIGDDSAAVVPGQALATLRRPSFRESKLHTIEIRWKGPKPLIIRRIELSTSR